MQPCQHTVAAYLVPLARARTRLAALTPRPRPLAISLLGVPVMAHPLAAHPLAALAPPPATPPASPLHHLAAHPLALLPVVATRLLLERQYPAVRTAGR